MALGLAAPALGPNAAVNQIRWVALYPLAILGFWLWRRASKSELCLFAVLAFAAFSLLWVPDRLNAILHLTHAAALFGAFLLARRWDLIPGVVLAYVPIAGYQVYAFGWISLGDYNVYRGWFGNENWNAEFLLIGALLVASWGLQARWQAIMAVVLLALAMVGMCLSHTNLHWYVIGAWTWSMMLFCFTGYRAYGEKIVATILVVVGALILADGTSFETSIYHRFELWWNALHAWWASPVWGHGIGSFDYVYDTFRERHYWWRETTVFSGAAQFAGAAHNLPIQILVELGLIGLLLMAVASLAVIKSLPVNWAAIAFAIAALLSMIGFPEQNPQTGLLIAIALGSALRRDSPVDWRLCVDRARGIARRLASRQNLHAVGQMASGSAGRELARDKDQSL